MTETKTRADGGSAASQAVDLDQRSWTARPTLAWAVRGFVFLIPLLGSVLVTYMYRALVPRPSGWPATVAWWTGAIAAAMVSVRQIERIARRLLPVAMLFRMSLVFPDQAPSRFKTALRTGTTNQLRRRLDELEDQTDPTTQNEAAQLLLALVARLSTHDRLTRGHSERVRAYADLIAEEMDLPAEDREKLHWAALIHDVGKLWVPTEILNKKGRPTDEEWEILRNHPGAGEPLVDPLRDWLGEWALATTQHHERYDGKGYPAGLAGTDISLAGRIVGVADAYDVMTSARSYKKPLPAAQARAELARNAGTQFDPTVVRAFLAVGVRRTRVALGPLAWLTELPGLVHVPSVASTSVGSAATAAVTAAAVIAGSIAATGGVLEDPPAPPIERVVEAYELTGNEVDEPPTGGETTDSSIPPSTTAPLWTTATTTTEADPSTVVPSTTTDRVRATEASTTTTTAPPTTTAPAAPAPTTTAPAAPAPTATAPITTAPPTTTAAPSAGPNAFDDTAVVGATTSQIPVLANDLDAGYPVDLATLSIVESPDHALTYGVTYGRVRYHPVIGFAGTDHLVYRICDTGGGCDTATVYITIEP